jgi:hypothetical protein
MDIEIPNIGATIIASGPEVFEPRPRHEFGLARGLSMHQGIEATKGARVLGFHGDPSGRDVKRIATCLVHVWLPTFHLSHIQRRNNWLA